MRWLPILLALAATHVVADTDNGQAVFDVGHEATSQPIDATEVRPKRVAIIGAGASGAAAALFMSRAAREAEQQRGMKKGELLGDLVVYEQNDYVGGRELSVFRQELTFRQHRSVSARRQEAAARRAWR